MFETKKTLIVIYKDELVMNQLKKMIETHDDTEDGIVGTRDDSINIVAWTEKVWLANKKAGNIQGKILYLGDIKETDKLIPVLDVKFSDSGVKYGWAGNQAVVFVDTKALTNREDYNLFLKKLNELPVPKFLKKDIASPDETDEEETLSDDKPEEVTVLETNEEENEKKNRFSDFLNKAKKAYESSSVVIGKVGKDVSVKTEELFRDKSLMKRQMLFYGVINIYYNGLETFMNI